MAARPNSRLCVVLGLALLSACARPTLAPRDTGICWRITNQDERAPRFARVAAGVANLETCGARLEALRMITGRPADGAYQGYFVFAEETRITASYGLTAPRFLLIDPQVRTRLRAATQRLIDARARQADLDAPPNHLGYARIMPR